MSESCHCLPPPAPDEPFDDVFAAWPGEDTKAWQDILETAIDTVPPPRRDA